MKQDITYETKVRKEEMSSVHMPYYIKSFGEIMEQRILKDIFDSIHTKIERPEDGDHIIIKTTITVELPEQEEAPDPTDRYVNGNVTKEEYDFLKNKDNNYFLHELRDHTSNIMDAFNRYVGEHPLLNPDDENKEFNFPDSIYEDVDRQVFKASKELHNLYSLLVNIHFVEDKAQPEVKIDDIFDKLES